MPELIEDASTELTGSFRLLTQRLLDHLKELDRQVSELESQIVAWHRQNSASSKLARIPGIGPITASALAASLNWINGVVSRRNKNVAAVALANKNARIVWALLSDDREFRPDYTTSPKAWVCSQVG